VFAVAPEFARVTGRDALAAETIEAHANAVVEWLVAGALAQGNARPQTKRTRRTR
jgi:hypothetical protein